jgi:uncharacterized protein (TIGR02145 family)
MKRVSFFLTVFLIIFLFTGMIHGQAPEAIKYQAVARNQQGEPVVNTLVGVQISIFQGGTTGTPVYRETHSALANNFGIIGLDIGMGSVSLGNFSQINWGADESFVEVAMDFSGGTNYSITGTSQLLAVPYALYAKYAENGGGGSSQQCLSVSETGDTLYISGCNWVIVPGISAANWGGSGELVYDYDGNAYETVQIGSQTWLKQSMRTEHYANGTEITESYAYADNASNAVTYGRLYTWSAAMDGASSSNGNPSGVQGVCMDGWHLPSKAEFEQMVTFLGGIIGTGGKLKETGTTYWIAPNSGATNESGFSARGAGQRDLLGTYNYLKEQNYLWMSTENNANTSYNLTLYSNQTGAMTHTNNKDAAFSVRCVKD